MKTASLGEVADIISGATPKTGVADYWDGDVRWATPADLSKLDGAYIADSPRKLTAAGVRSCATSVLPEGSVLLSSRAPIGHVAINAIPMATNQGFKSLIPGPDLDAKFLYYWLKSKTHYLQSLGNGATFKELSKKTTEKIQIPLPPLEEQRRIAAILDHADALRTKRRQVLAHLDTLAQSIFHDMFGDVAWASTLGELADVQIGPFGSLLHKDDYVSGGVPVLNPMHIRGGQIKPDYEFAVSDEKAASLPQYRIRTGDILLGRRGEMGRAGVAIPAHDGMLCGTGSLILRPRYGDSSYLHAVATSPRMKKHLERNSLGSTLPNLNTGIVKSSPAPAAGIERQREFAGCIAQVHVDRDAVVQAQTADNELFASLQSRAFRGEL